MGQVGEVAEIPRALLIFARAPEAGRVKTRLAAELGSEAALAAYRTMADRVISAVLPGAGAGYSVTVVYTPKDASKIVRGWLGDEIRLRPQGDGDLGLRMKIAIQEAIDDGAERVVVIGTDCPDVNTSVVEDAFQRLTGADVVLGPATDGGYYLIGMTRLQPALFENVPWSSPDTLRSTLDLARAAGCSVALLDERRDIDTADDWRAWCASQAQPPATAI